VPSKNNNARDAKDARDARDAKERRFFKASLASKRVYFFFILAKYPTLSVLIKLIYNYNCYFQKEE